MHFFVGLIISLFCCTSLIAQINNEITITLNPTLNSHQLILEKESLDGTTINSLKFYLSNFSLSKKGKTVWKQENSYHLIDASNSSTLKIQLAPKNNISYDEIQFLLGTDSLINVSGVMGGDLDPTKGMYWAWNSGYINFKLEGKSKGIPIELHLGGYSPPTAQPIKVQTTNNDLTINIDIHNFLSSLDLKNQNKLMSPGKEAQVISKIAAEQFKLNE